MKIEQWRKIILIPPYQSIYHEGIKKSFKRSVEAYCKCVIINPEAWSLNQQFRWIHRKSTRNVRYRLHYFSPEFLREGRPYTILYPSRIIVGEQSEREEVFKPFS